MSEMIELNAEEDVRKMIECHESALRALTFKSSDKHFGKVAITGEKLAMWFSKGLCEVCSSPNELTIHHLVNRMNKILPEHRYLMARHHYSNISVLCSKCHCAAEGRPYVENVMLTKKTTRKVQDE